MLPLLVLAEDPASDARLKAPMKVAERYLPTSELARRIRASAGVPVKLDGGMAERKLTLFVDGRPIAETMRMVASALGGHWIQIGPEWHLRPDTELAQAESAARDEEAAAQRAALVHWAERTAARPKGSLKAFDRCVAALVTQVGAQAAAETLASGRPLVGTPNGEWGTPRVSLAGAGEISNGPTLEGFRAMGLTLRSPDAVSAFLVSADEGSGSNLMAVLPTGFRESKTGLALERKQKAWAVDGDLGVSATRLATLTAEKDPTSTGLMSLADGLARLHARAKLPVAAEAFRMPVGTFRDLGGATVDAALDGLGQATGPFRSSFMKFGWRTERGWVLARPVGAWKLRPGEIPEAPLVLLEKKPPTLDDYATLAASLTDAQRRAIAGSLRPLVNFRTNPLRMGYWGLVVYAALGAGERKTAERGMPFAALPAAAQARWTDAVRELAFESVPKGSWLEAYFTGRPLEGAGFRIDRESMGIGRDLESPGAAAGPGAPIDQFSGLIFRFSLVDYYPSAMVPLTKAP